MPKLAVLFVFAVTAAAQAVEGRVSDAATGAGIAGAYVAVLDLAGKTVAGGTADDQGRFQIEGVKDGVYRSRAFAPEYPLNFPDPHTFPVVGGKATLEIHLARRPTVSGRVLDSSGEGVAGAKVVLTGRPPFGQLAAITDEKGRFATIGETGVSYLLSAMPPADLKPPAPDPETGAERGWARTYYPGVIPADAASPISASAGADLTNLEWKLQAAPVYSVRGILLRPDGVPAPNVDIDVGEDPSKPTAGAETKEDGTFELRVVNGRWRVDAELDGAFGERPRAGQWIEVAGHDVDGLKLRASVPFTVHGQVKMETPEGAPAPDRPAVSLCPAEGSCSSAQPDEAGNFRLERIYPGAYNIALRVPPPGYYLDAVRLGDAEWSQPSEIASAGVPLTLVYKRNGGILRGAVENCGSGGVLLVLADGAHRYGLPHPVACEDAPVGPAHYEFRDIAPGAYYAIAISGAGSTPWIIRASALPLDRLESLGVAITIRAGEATTADLHAVIPPQ